MTTSSEQRQILVIGGGPAAHRFAEAIASREPAGTHLTVLTEETHLPYDRVALSKALTDPGVDLTLGDAALWEQEHLTLHTGARAVSLDSAARRVRTEDGREFGYDELVLATGSNAATLPIPGAELTHVYRTLEDVWGIAEQVRTLAENLGRTPVVATIGGGLLGLEAAAGVQALGAKALIIDGGHWLMGTQLDQGAGQALGRLVAEKDLTVHGGVYPEKILSRERPGHRRAHGRRQGHRCGHGDRVHRCPSA